MRRGRNGCWHRFTTPFTQRGFNLFQRPVPRLEDHLVDEPDGQEAQDTVADEQAPRTEEVQ